MVRHVHSCNGFRRTLDRERARANRSECQFSVLLLDTDALRDPGARERLIRKLDERIRTIDEIGWFDERRVGVLLPYTSASGALRLANDVRRLTMPSPPRVETYTYPGQWLPEEDAEPATSGGEGDEAGSGLLHEEAPTVSVGNPEALFENDFPVWKRAIDVAVSAVALVLLAPLFVLVAATIAVVSPGPVFLKQKRVGYQGKSFNIWKFRTMREGADPKVHQQHFKMLMSDDVPLTKLDLKGDPRVIPLGHFVRRCYLDELPQLINVLRGDMSLVGPRPCLAFAVSQYRPWQRMRCDAVPGMTGLWQVSGKNKTTFKEMLRLDIAYVRRRSLSLDVRIVLRTLPAIFGELIDSVSGHKNVNANLYGGRQEGQAFDRHPAGLKLGRTAPNVSNEGANGGPKS